MSRPQAHPESLSASGGFLEEIVTFVVNVVEVARDWVVALWSPPVPASETPQAKDALKQASVALPQKDPSTSPYVFSAEVEGPNPLSDVGTSGNTEHSSTLPPQAQENLLRYPTTRDLDVSSILPPKATQSQDQLSYPTTRDLDEATIADKVEEPRDEVPLVQDRQAEPIHESAMASDSSQEWVSLSKPDLESPSIEASDVRPEEPTTSFVPPEHEDPGSSSLQEPIVAPTLVDAPTMPHEFAATTELDTSTPPLSTPEPDTNNTAVRVQTDAEEQAPLNPESNVESGSVSEVLKARISTPSLHDSASISGAQAGAGTSELPIKKQRGGSFIKRQSTLMTKVFKSKPGSGDNGGPTKFTSPSSASLNVDNKSLASSLVSEPDAVDHSTPAPDVSSADTAVDKKMSSPSRVSIGSIRTIGSIKKKFGRRGSTASDKDIASAVSAPDQESRSKTPELLNVVPSNPNQPSKVADATGPSLLKTMFKVRKPLKVDDLRT